MDGDQEVFHLEEFENQIMNVINFEEIKARAIMVILRIKIKGCSTEYNHGETKGTRRKS